ncbi:MAG TPA: pullulanase-type alpha-1,6-glucosidase [Anaeromyxobacteraceae bacterium]|nr:pullulanase-type alpha-1,6-glucosidase [Anaeromyxobacteraceae bacterium]
MTRWCAIVPVLASALAAIPARASHTPPPTSVVLPGSFQSEAGCPGDWQPDCAATGMTYDADDGVWQARLDLPAGAFEYKAALNGSWTENYGLGAAANGPNIPLSLASPGSVKFYYDHGTHWVTDDRSSIIATAPGSYQSELGCASDWDPGCLRSWLQDPDGDGVYTFRTRALPAGSYEVKVAIGESWNENYGAGGVQNGPNIPFTVPSDCVEMLFSYDAASHLLTVSAAPAPPQPSSATVAGSLQSELGCPGDWQPECAATFLGFDAADGVWQGTFALPAGPFEYKAALNGSWTENYGLHATRDGPNIPLSLAAAEQVKFYYDHATHWITDGHSSVIATAPGSYQSELGCPGDWQPDCLRSWLQDPDGDGSYQFSARLPAGSYEAKVAIAESWSENYGAGGVRDGPNIPFSVSHSCSEVFFTYDAATHLLTIGEQGGPKGNLGLAKAHWLSRDTVAWNVAVQPGQVFRLHYSPDASLGLDATGVTGGSAVALTPDPAGLPAWLRAKFPHLAGFAAFKIGAADLGLVKGILKGQVAVSAAAADGSPLDATSVQIPGVLDDLYPYAGPLGVGWSGAQPTLRVWAPTARSVSLELYPDSISTAATAVAMSEDPQSGVWTATGSSDWRWRFYRYRVEVYAPSTRRIEANLVTDPWSLSLSVNSQRTQIVDLSDPMLKPEGWDQLRKPPLAAPEDIVLYELHVRDFSATDPTVPPALRGTFLAFAQDEANGMLHLRRLAKAGLTHVHLLPAFDIATVNEDRSTWKAPACDLPSLPPASEAQQACVMAVAPEDGFNWGYDPWHYTVPEGSYSTAPDGPERIREFRQMVMGLARAGLRTVMDVVYNHTNASGQNQKSVLDRIVPGYYHRLDLNGNVEHSSCCENTASEHAMMEKLMVDSVVTWARDYKVDGFRFDLMGHHMRSNLLRVRAALDALAPSRDGVDGRSVYVYGEGWNFGEVADGARGVNATQLNMAGTGIGTFSDRLRDAVRGGGPFSPRRDQGFATGLWHEPNGAPQGTDAEMRERLLHLADLTRLGLAGNLADFRLQDHTGATVPGSALDYNGQPAGYALRPDDTITYVSAHDNETWFDAMNVKVAQATSMADRVRQHDLGVSIAALSQGIPFFHAGDELMRSKSGDKNSYDSGDWFNRLDWTGLGSAWGSGLPPAGSNQSDWGILSPLLADPALKPGPDAIRRAEDHFEEMLRIRKSSTLFRLRSAEAIGAALTFLDGGPAQTPGLVVMRLVRPAGWGREPGDYGQALVVVNATPREQRFTASVLRGQKLGLHPVQKSSSDPVVRASSFDCRTGQASVPARTVAVFMGRQPPWSPSAGCGE